MAVFTKFDGKIVEEFETLSNIENDEQVEVKWDMARESAEIIFQRNYLPKVLSTPNPPKAYVRLEGEDYKHSLLEK